MRNFRGEEDEMAAAKARHAQRDAEEYREDKVRSENQWRAGERRRRDAARASASSLRPPGPSWLFTELNDIYGNIDGWRVDYGGELQGMLIIRNGDLLAFAAGDSLTSPGPEEILEAFLHLYPRHRPPRLPAPRLPEES